MDNLALGVKLSQDEPFAYNTLICVFRFLDFKDLLNCTQVCKVWCWIAQDESLWKSIRSCTKHIQGVAKSHGGKIRHLDLLSPKLISLESLNNISIMMTHLLRISLFGCHKDQLKLLAVNHLNLERIYAEINWGDPPMELNFIENLKDLSHLELITHIEITEVENLKKLNKLKHLVFHAPCEEYCWKHIAQIENLESISLDANIGTTWDIALFGACFYIVGLKYLKKLCVSDLPYFHEYDILEKVKDLPNIKELVLLNVSISRAGTSSFGRLLGNCHNIEKLTLSILRVVFYSSVLDVALENTEIINGVIALKCSLKYFCWIMDSSGLSSIKDFYHLDNATAIKVDKNKHPIKIGKRSPFIEGLAPITMTNLLEVLQKKLPSTKVSLLDPPNDGENIVKERCFLCEEKIMTAQDRMESYT